MTRFAFSPSVLLERYLEPGRYPILVWLISVLVCPSSGQGYYAHISLRNRKRYCTFAFTLQAKGSNCCSLKISRDMGTKSFQIRQSVQEGTSVRDIGQESPQCVILLEALKCSSTSEVCFPGSWILVWWSTWLYTSWCLTHAVSWSPTGSVYGLQSKHF